MLSSDETVTPTYIHWHDVWEPSLWSVASTAGTNREGADPQIYVCWDLFLFVDISVYEKCLG